MNENPFIRQGWECPKCGRVYSPDTFICYHCNNERTNFATTKTTYISDLVDTLSDSRDMADEEREEYNRTIKDN